jgi:hypothetical protein
MAIGECFPQFSSPSLATFIIPFILQTTVLYSVSLSSGIVHNALHAQILHSFTLFTVCFEFSGGLTAQTQRYCSLPSLDQVFRTIHAVCEGCVLWRGWVEDVEMWRYIGDLLSELRSATCRFTDLLFVDSCDANPTFQPTLVGGDGNELQVCTWKTSILKASRYNS